MYLETVMLLIILMTASISIPQAMQLNYTTVKHLTTEKAMETDRALK